MRVWLPGVPTVAERQGAQDIEGTLAEARPVRLNHLLAAGEQRLEGFLSCCPRGFAVLRDSPSLSHRVTRSTRQGCVARKPGCAVRRSNRSEWICVRPHMAQKP
jgi:hypothetical protein